MCAPENAPCRNNRNAEDSVPYGFKGSILMPAKLLNGFRRMRPNQYKSERRGCTVGRNAPHLAVYGISHEIKKQA